MRKNRKLITSICICLLAVLCAVLPFLDWKGEVAQAQTVTFESSEIKTTYNLNEKVRFPQSVKVDYNGEKTGTNGVLVYPNGDIYPIGETEMLLSEEGRYELRYFFMQDGAQITACADFKVYSMLFGLSATNGSTITAVTEQMNNETEMTDTDIDAMRDNKEGLILRLYEGCEFVYNKPVDLRDCDADGLTSVITFHPRTCRQETITRTDNGKQEFVNAEQIAGNTYIRLTDCYDCDKFVELVLDNKSAGKNLICYRAGSNAQESAGIYLPDATTSTSFNKKEVYYDGVRGIARFFDWGPYNFGYRAYGKTDGITLRYDFASSKIYVQCGKEQLFVNDLANSDIYGENLFEGFTTGEVFVSVRCDDYYLAEATRIDITKVGKDSGSLLTGGLAGKVEACPEYKDDIKPAIKVAVEKTDAYGIYGAIGDSIAVPSATVYDVNDSGRLQVGVYRKDTAGNKISVDIVNGKFTLTENDIYYIEYKSTDLYGNQGVEVLEVYVNAKAQKGLSLNAEKVSALSAGKEAYLPVPQIQTLNDSEKLNLSVLVTREGQEPELIATAYGMENILALTQEDFAYRPLYSGAYTITYLCSDNLNTEEFTYTVNCAPSNAVVFMDKPFLSRTLIKNATYAIDNIQAYSFASGEPKPIDAQAFVSFDGGEFVKIDDVNKVKITGSQTAKLKFTCDGAEADVFSDEVKIVDVNFGTGMNLENYFYGENFTVATEDAEGAELSNIRYHSLVQTGDNILHFVNPISVNSFLLEFLVPVSQSNYKEMTVILTDPYDTSKKITITYGNNDGSAYASVNGGARTNLSLPFADDVQSNRTFYDYSARQFVVQGAKFDCDIDFTTAACYLDISLNGIYGDSAIEIRSVNNQNFNRNLHFDMNKPEVSIYKSEGTYKIGDIVTVYNPQFLDVLSPVDVSGIKLTVTYNGAFVSSVDGVLLDGIHNDPLKTYQIAPKELGNYRVSYSAHDSSSTSESASASYMFTVVDTVAPVITIEEGYNEDTKIQMTAGEKLSFHYTLADNVDEELTAFVIVTNIHTLVNHTYTSGEFFMDEVGEYDVHVVCVDEAGNVATVTFRVIAEKEAE